MKHFDYSKLAERTWDNEIISYISKIHEYKGKQELYLRQKPVELERLIEIAKIQSTEASNRIEGIITTKARLKQLVADKTVPSSESLKHDRGGLAQIVQGFAGAASPQCGTGMTR